MIGDDKIKLNTPQNDLEIWDEIQYVWVIENWSEMVKKMFENIYSPRLECAGANWQLELYAEDHESVSVYLECRDDSSETQQLGWNRYASFDIAIVNTKNHGIQTKQAVLPYTFDCFEFEWILIKDMKHSELNSLNVLENDALSIILELRVYKSEMSQVGIPFQDFAAEATAWASKAAKLGFNLNLTAMEPHSHAVDFSTPSERLKEYVHSPILSDVQLIVNIKTLYGIIQKSFFGHKETLAASSKYFEVMFNPDSGFKESFDFTIKTQLPVALESDEMLLILDFAYTGSKKGILAECERAKSSTDSCLLHLTMVAEYLQMDSLLCFLYEELVKLHTSIFNPQVGWMENTVISKEIISTMCGSKGVSLRKALRWLELTLSSEGRPHGWDLTPEGLDQLHELIDTFICPRSKDLPLMYFPKLFKGLSPKLLSHLPIESILPSVLSHK